MAEHHHRHEDDAATGIGVPQQFPKGLALVGPALQMSAHRRDHAKHEAPHDRADRGDNEKGHPPAPQVGQLQTDRHADRRGDGKRGHDDADAGGPAGGRHQVAHDREAKGTGDAAEGPADRAGDKQGVGIGREPTEQRGHGEAGIHHQQERAPVKTVDKRRAQQTDDARRDRVGRNQRAELPRPQIQLAHQLRRERHHDHEVHDVRELNRRQDQQDEAL
ncbi:MAG: hypothetical protein WDM96_18135 [Lacunisphaera sp.]